MAKCRPSLRPREGGRVVNETAREKEDEERNGKKNVSKEIVWQTTAIHPQERKKKEKECTPQKAERDMLSRKVRNEMKEINERHKLLNEEAKRHELENKRLRERSHKLKLKIQMQREQLEGK